MRGLRLLAAAFALALLGAAATSQSTDPLSATKPDPVAKAPGTDAGWFSALQMLGAVLLVGAAVRWGLPKWLKTRPKGMRASGDGSLRVLETVANGAGTFQIVEAMGRQFLVASGASGATLLAELTPQRFETVLREASGGAEAPPANDTDIRDRVAAAAARLDELVGR
jgi:hypothetical protein